MINFKSNFELLMTPAVQIDIVQDCSRVGVYRFLTLEKPSGLV